MLALKEIIQLKKDLESDCISLEKAKGLFWEQNKKGKESWRSKDWQERRKNFIKDNCQICGSTDKLTLQHLSHPKKYNEYENLIIREYTESHISNTDVFDKNKFREHVINDFDYKAAPLCPKCFSRKPNVRMKKSPKYLCTSCHYEFDETVSRSVEELIDIFFKDIDSADTRDKCFVSRNQWKNRQNLFNIKYYFQRDEAKNRNAKKIEREAFLLYLDDQIKYLSFEDTITACNRCAFNFDINKMDLCPSCKKNYKGIQYQTCIQCLPEEKRKATLEKIDLANQMYELHKRLGID
ncbi:MAG: hypothetical protein HWE09_08410 [Cyclobacteriaceae bacterium]|uniref:hypothetical protein n=1 Tax=Algoriphagus sp. TaxID=1872435 RepID=UPI00185A1315|nr:hypothetical protein [Algoriphagus sp.]NVJ86477.1 hypothetical protein [Algoriphagus sp.]NVK49778.1 hypothetical protein [Cyclobacteriaceae bacterium]